MKKVKDGVLNEVGRNMEKQLINTRKKILIFETLILDQQKRKERKLSLV